MDGVDDYGLEKRLNLRRHMRLWTVTSLRESRNPALHVDKVQRLQI